MKITLEVPNLKPKIELDLYFKYGVESNLKVGQKCWMKSLVEGQNDWIVQNTLRQMPMPITAGYYNLILSWTQSNFVRDLAHDIMPFNPEIECHSEPIFPKIYYWEQNTKYKEESWITFEFVYQGFTHYEHYKLESWSQGNGDYIYRLEKNIPNQTDTFINGHKLKLKPEMEATKVLICTEELLTDEQKRSFKHENTAEFGTGCD